MIRVRFVSADGMETREVSAEEGAILLDVAQADGQPLEGTCEKIRPNPNKAITTREVFVSAQDLATQPLEGTCEGQMACSTCHVIVSADDFARLPPAVEEEEDMLDLAAGATRTSRLACQIVLTPALDGLTVRMPGEHRDMQGR